MQLDDLSTWARGKGLEIVLLALGGVLVTRALDWGAVRLTAHLQRTGGVGAVADDPAVVVSERAKHLYALVQAIERACVALVWFLVVVLVLVRFNVPLTTLVAPATVVGVAVGFGAQRLVGDLLSGFFLVTERQYGVGDMIEISAPGQTTGIAGTVEEMTLRVTRLRTLTGDVVVIPNGEIRQLTNRSREWSRVVVDIPVAIESDIDAAMTALRRAGDSVYDDERWRRLLLARPRVTGVEAIDLDRVQLRVVARTLPARQWDVGRELRRRAVVALHDAGIADRAAS